MYSIKSRRLFVFVAVPLALTGCGGASGGPGGPGGTTSFTKFPLQSGKSTTIKGTGREAGYTTDAQGIKVSAFGEASEVQADLTKNAESGDISSVALKTGTTTKTWDHKISELAYSKNGKLVIADANDDSGSIGFAIPDKNGFTYQTYGSWLTKGTDGGKAGAFSIGSETAKADIPTSSTATFTGTAGGIHIGDRGQDVMSADAALNVDFGAKTAAFSTSNTVLENGGAANNLNMAGDLAIEAGGLSGNIATADKGMTGTANGHFYGSKAQEVGGTFDLKGGGATMVGGYGAVKQ